MDSKTNWTSSDYLNYEDLNRIEKNTQYLSELLKKYGYYNNLDKVKTDWTMNDIIYNEDLNRISNNLKIVLNTYYHTSKTDSDAKRIKTDWKVLETVYYTDINAFEKILNDIEYLINSMQTRFGHSGVANAGQNKTYQNRFRTKRTWSAIPFNAISNVLDWYEVKNIATQSDSLDNTYSESSSVYGNILYYNESLNKLDKIIGGDN